MFNAQITNSKFQTIYNFPNSNGQNSHFGNCVIVICKLFVVWNLVIGIFIWLTPAPLFADGPSDLNALPQEVHQAVLVEGAAGAVTAKISGWERKDGHWRQVLGPVEAVVGRNGLAPAGEKREGDGRTPSGVFALRRAFGYEERVPTGFVYRRASERDFWIDDPASAQYNQWVTGDVPAVSHEALRRGDDLYKYAVVIEYNTDPVVPGLGSAIFMHVWRGAGQPTAGCVAMAEADLLRFLRWLDLRQNPVVILSGD